MADAASSTVEETISVELFDPPLCCPTGLCGPTLDQTLLDVNEMVLSMQARGIPVVRYQMASSPQVFLKRPEVLSLIRERHMEAFPITVVGGRIIRVGSYPAPAEVEQALIEARGAAV